MTGLVFVALISEGPRRGPKFISELGFTVYWSYGQNDKAIEAIQRGIGKGVKDKNDAQLRLGLAYLSAGKRAQALEAFKAIAPGTPSAQVARLWQLQSTKA